MKRLDDHSFTEQDYLTIWGSVHRHDYTEGLASSLIAKYGKCSILDIGTGCGHLVKVLRERGCDAWGLELSEYALTNRCSPYVVPGDVRAIPFKDGRFDVVHSQGMWEYVPEADVAGAAAECRRVGRQQEHNIDHDKTDHRPEYKHVTWKPLAWWQGKLGI